MLIPFLLGLRLVAPPAPTDSAVYTVYNHNRPAGTMVVWHWGDSARVRFIFVDRNRGTRTEARYHTIGDEAAGIEIRNILADGTAGDPTNRMELFADSVRRWTPARTTTTKAEPGAFYTMGFTPFDSRAIRQCSSNAGRRW